jgi:dienelactone hydrolase
VTPDLYTALTIDALANREYGGGELSIVETLERNDSFTRYLVEYPSDGLLISGYMNVPHEGSRFPVAIVLHGYVPPADFETVAYTRRYADGLAKAGYFVIHPNLRNYPPSDEGPDLFRTGMAIDVLNLIALIQAQSQDALGPLRRANGDELHLWGHSMGGGVALRVVTVNNDPALKTAVLYGSMSGDEALNYGRIIEWSGGQRGEVELSLPEETMAAISPINHLQRIKAAISIHHSDADDVVPLAWSEDLCRRLQGIGQEVECYVYQGAPHTFSGVWDEVFMERYIRFFDQH